MKLLKFREVLRFNSLIYGEEAEFFPISNCEGEAQLQLLFPASNMINIIEENSDLLRCIYHQALMEFIFRPMFGYRAARSSNLQTRTTPIGREAYVIAEFMECYVRIHGRVCKPVGVEMVMALFNIDESYFLDLLVFYFSISHFIRQVKTE